MDKVLMKGNEALAEAAILSGCKHFFGYPITPQTEVAAYMSKRLPKMGGVYLQAESEISAINMVYGAAGAGARVLTSSSSPGVSLKMEGISYIAAADLPCVIINIMRSGPGLGGILPAQGDYFQATKGGGHGDYHLLVLAPASVQEAIDLMMDAFDLADFYRVPAMIMGDGSLGQMMEPVEFIKKPRENLPKKTWAANGTECKREHNVINSLYVKPDELEAIIDERYLKYAEIEKNEVRFEEEFTEDAELVLVSFGIVSRVVKSAVKAAREKGLKVGLLRPITLWPFPKEPINRLSKTAKSMLCVEMNKGQMVEDVVLAANGNCPVEFYGRTGGFVPTSAEILEQIEKVLGGGK